MIAQQRQLRCIYQDEDDITSIQHNRAPRYTSCTVLRRRNIGPVRRLWCRMSSNALCEKVYDPVHSNIRIRI